MLDQERNPPPPEGQRDGNGASGAPPPPREAARPSLQAWTDHVAASLTASTYEILERFARELRQPLSAIRARLDEASGRLEGELEVYREVPGQIAEALETLGQALTEVAGAQAAVHERLAALSERTSAEIASASDAAAEREERLASSLEAARASIAELGAAHHRVAEDVGQVRVAVAADLADQVGDVVAAPLEALREDMAQLRARLETGGKSRPAARLAADLSAVESRLEQVEAAVGHDLVEAVFDRMEQAFDRRFDALVQVIDARLRDVGAPPAEPARRGLLRRA